MRASRFYYWNTTRKAETPAPSAHRAPENPNYIFTSAPCPFEKGANWIASRTSKPQASPSNYPIFQMSEYRLCVACIHPAIFQANNIFGKISWVGICQMGNEKNKNTKENTSLRIGQEKLGSVAWCSRSVKFLNFWRLTVSHQEQVPG